MKGSEQNPQAAPTPDATAPFFARFLEGQQAGDDAVLAAPQRMTLKYPSDRDEIDPDSSARAEAEATKAGPSRMTLKYPSDRDEIDN